MEEDLAAFPRSLRSLDFPIKGSHLLKKSLGYQCPEGCTENVKASRTALLHRGIFREFLCVYGPWKLTLGQAGRNEGGSGAGLPGVWGTASPGWLHFAPHQVPHPADRTEEPKPTAFLLESQKANNCFCVPMEAFEELYSCSCSRNSEGRLPPL